ncbi:MAG: DsbE family thiol:disulfide interchange protein [Magnetospirillum sp.]|nr:DsbE family thiol:disulfide interchange protein [Magnetospirillum sp.]
MRRVLFVVPAALFGLLAVLFLRGLELDPRRVPSPLIDKAVPAFDLPPLSAAKPGLTGADLMGRVTVVNFFSSWCVPCRAEHPVLMDLARRPGVTLVGIDYKDQPADALAWLKRLGDPFGRIAADQDGRTAIDWGVYGVPESYVVDRQGRIRFKQVGPLTEADVKATVLPLLTELSK